MDLGTQALYLRKEDRFHQRRCQEFLQMHALVLIPVFHLDPFDIERSNRPFSRRRQRMIEAL